MDEVPVEQVRKKRTRVGLCVGLGIGLGGGGLVAFSVFAPCTHDLPREFAVEPKMREFSAKLETYRMIAGDYPTQEQGLMALVGWPEVEPVPERWQQLFRELPKDPWGSEYRYFYPGRRDSEVYEVVSGGQDLEFGTDDDISSQELE